MSKMILLITDDCHGFIGMLCLNLDFWDLRIMRKVP